MGNDIAREQFAHAGNAGQQRRRSGIHVHADRIDAILHNGVQGARQPVF